MAKERKSVLSFRLEPSTVDDLKVLAAAEGCTPSAWIRRAIETAIADAEPESDMPDKASQLGITAAELAAEAATFEASRAEFMAMTWTDIARLLRSQWQGHVNLGHPKPPCYRLDNGGPWVHVQPSCRCKDGP
jgi:hypothetical protein